MGISNFIHSHNPKDSARYLLGEQADRMIACLGINPSTARPEKLDRTMLSVKRIADYNGYDGYLMLNIYPQRATDPQRIHKRINKEYHNQNLEAVKQALEVYQINTLWLAYGDLIESRKYFANCLNDLLSSMEPFGLDYATAGKLTAKGHPRHPLYQSGKSPLQQFDLNVYLERTLKLTLHA